MPAIPISTDRLSISSAQQPRVVRSGMVPGLDDRSTTDVTLDSTQPGASANHVASKYENTISPLSKARIDTSFLKLRGRDHGRENELKGRMSSPALRCTLPPTSHSLHPFALSSVRSFGYTIH